jgi:hypothetical protein
MRVVLYILGAWLALSVVLAVAVGLLLRRARIRRTSVARRRGQAGSDGADRAA